MIIIIVNITIVMVSTKGMPYLMGQQPPHVKVESSLVKPHLDGYGGVSGQKN